MNGGYSYSHFKPECVNGSIAPGIIKAAKYI